MKDRYLTKLPIKSTEVAPGDIVGGLIYVMDKPVGVEPGMIGISRDSPAYLNFIKTHLALLESNLHPNTQLQSRFSQLLKSHKDFENFTLKNKINLLLEDKQHLVRRYGMSKSDLKKIFFSFGKYHEVKMFRKYYENVGCGGLLFHEYKNRAKINKKDHFADHIQKLTDIGNKVYMVKQDGEMFLGRTGPNVRRLMNTEVGRKMQILAHPVLSLATLGVSALIFGVGILGWRAMIMRQNKPIEANSTAIVEEIATKMANIRGFNSQEIELIEGTYQNATPKYATIVTWSPGCRDLTGKLAGGEKHKTNVIVSWDKEGAHLKVDTNGNIIRIRKEKVNGVKRVIYEKILEDGKTAPATEQEYNNAMAVSEDRIAGLGESLISFISMGDRDGIGEVGQNKVILKLDPPQGKYQYQFFGIDFGKAYEKENPIINSLKDDFSVINPLSRRSRFLNISVLYDNPLREKMKGVYLLAALRNKLTKEEKEKIASEFEKSDDKAFADKLRSYPESLFEKYGEDIGLELKGAEGEQLLSSQQIKRWIKNGDLWWIKNQENKYREKASGAKAKKAHYLEYADKLATIYKLAQAADKKVLEVFEKRYRLTPSQIDMLEKLEKLTARHVHITTTDGVVLLNHLRVEPEDRVAWQCEEKDGKWTLICQETENLQEIQNKLILIKNNPVISKMKLENNRLTLSDLTQNEVDIFNKQITEDTIASVRSDTAGFRTKFKRDDFYDRLKKFEENQQKIATEAIKQSASVKPIPPVQSTDIRTKPIVHYAAKKLQKANIYLQNQMNTQKLVEHYQYFQEQYNNLHLKINSKEKVVIDLKKTVKQKTYHFQAYVKENSLKNELNYSVKRELLREENEKDFLFVCQNLCQLAVNAASPQTTFDVSSAPLEKREILQQTFEEAISKAMLEKRFNENTKPVIIGLDKPAKPPLKAKNL